MRLLFAVVFLIVDCTAFGQENMTAHNDSLMKSIDALSDDSLKIVRLSEWDNSVYYFDSPLSLFLNEKVADIAQKQIERKNNSIARKAFFLSELAIAYNNIAVVFKEYGDLVKSMEYNYRSLRICESTGNRKGAAQSLNNIGIILNTQGNYPEARVFLVKSLEIEKELGSKEGISDSYLNLGTLADNEGNRDLALDYYHKALQLDIELNDTFRMATSYNNIGCFQSEIHEFDKAYMSFETSLALYKAMNDLEGESMAYNNIGDLFFMQGKYVKALEYQKEALKISKEIKSKSGVMFSYFHITKIDSALGDYRNAFDHHKLYILYRDSLNNDDNTRKTVMLQMQYEFEKERVSDSLEHLQQSKIQEAEIARRDAEIVSKRNQQYFLFGGLALILIFSAITFRRYKISQKQKRIIEIQKRSVEIQKGIVEEKQKEITDSINYAKRLQSVYLPSIRIFEQFFKDSFIFLKPKDIVSGDFYWFYMQGAIADGKFTGQQSNIIFVAVADCTGHGVPGAMMSVVCCNALNDVVVARGISDPGLILDETREIITRSMKSESGSGQKDGMDISLCRINISTGELLFAGAHNSGWIVQHESGNVVELVPDKQPVGHFENAKPFTTRVYKENQGDMVYLFSDGFADQFGGPKGKKLKYATMQKLVCSVHSRPGKEQAEFLNQEFENWKGDLEQVDDVCIMGIRI